MLYVLGKSLNLTLPQLDRYVPAKLAGSDGAWLTETAAPRIPTRAGVVACVEITVSAVTVLAPFDSDVVVVALSLVTVGPMTFGLIDFAALDHAARPLVRPVVAFNASALGGETEIATSPKVASTSAGTVEIRPRLISRAVTH